MSKNLNREVAHVGDMTDRLKALQRAWEQGEAEKAVSLFLDTLAVLQNWTSELEAENG